jgi:hypothetical protein
VAARHDHIGAFAGECHSSGAADAGEGAGNENNLLAGHQLSLQFRDVLDVLVRRPTSPTTTWLRGITSVISRPSVQHPISSFRPVSLNRD